MFEDLLSLNGLSLDRLRNFCLIAQHGSLTQAAGGEPGRMALFSRQVKELETYFGVELRRRSGKGIALTEAGRQLAALAQQQFAGLEDFRRTCQNQPAEISLASGNSLLEWMLLPRCALLRRDLPGVHFRLFGQRTADVVSGLAQHHLDFGVLRQDAVPASLRTRKLPPLSYALFVPRRLMRSLTEANLRERMPGLPIATSAGGQFRERLESDAQKAGWPLRIELSCSSFTQAARAAESGAYAAVLPRIAATQLSGSTIQCYDLPFLKAYLRPLVLAWHPRTERVRSVLPKVRDCLVPLLHGKE